MTSFWRHQYPNAWPDKTLLKRFNLNLLDKSKPGYPWCPAPRVSPDPRSCRSGPWWSGFRPRKGSSGGASSARLSSEVLEARCGWGQAVAPRTGWPRSWKARTLTVGKRAIARIVKTRFLWTQVPILGQCQPQATQVRFSFSSLFNSHFTQSEPFRMASSSKNGVEPSISGSRDHYAPTMNQSFLD